MGIKQWLLPNVEEEVIRELCGQSGYSQLLCAVLANRGFCNANDLHRLLGNDPHLDDPLSLADIDKAVSRIQKALQENERIAVFGDYDCDGVTSTALLVSYLSSVGADVFYYIPDRDKEGYGMSIKAIDTLRDLGADLIVTVDNGISAHNEISYALSLGIDTVITDHHTPRETLPSAVAVVNPKRSDCPSLFKDLAGVGVVFKLICALEGDSGEELLEHYSDLVMLGTLADVVALTGENRSIVAHGLSELHNTHRPGLASLIELSGISTERISSESAAFGIIPRINAAGRMGCADDAVELLLTDDISYAQGVAEEINRLNELRKSAESRISEDINELLTQNPALASKRILILTGKGWHHGVVGIAAAKVMERFGKPAILISVTDDGQARGSGRSIEGFSIISAISQSSTHLTRYGGHPLAAGLTLPADKIADFTHEIERYADLNFPLMPIQTLKVDCLVSWNQLTPESVASISLLEPFGANNPLPLFLIREISIEGIHPTADKKHIRIRFADGSDSFWGVYFNMSENLFPYRCSDKVDAIVSLSLSEYNGKIQISVKIKDIRLSGVPEKELLEGNERYLRHKSGSYSGADRTFLLPSRDDIAAVYRYLRRLSSFSHSDFELFYRLIPTGISYEKMLVALDVLEEMNLITRAAQSLQTIPSPLKVDIESSQILFSLANSK